MKRLLSRTPLAVMVRNWREARRLVDWEVNGRPLPPPHLWKVEMLRTYARRFAIQRLVETGTYRGDTTFALRAEFKRITTIELSDPLFRDACRRFAPYPHIEVLHGDSARVLAESLARTSEPCLFWLDAHYSAGITARGDFETPIVRAHRHRQPPGSAARSVDRRRPLLRWNKRLPYARRPA